MDQSWMQASRISDEYENGVEQFLQFTKCNAHHLCVEIFSVQVLNVEMGDANQ